MSEEEVQNKFPINGEESNPFSSCDGTEDTGYILEVDLEYPKELHDKHNYLPLCPEKVKVNKTKKLCATLNDKKHYVIHYQALKKYLEYGMKLKKVHKVLTFH